MSKDVNYQELTKFISEWNDEVRRLRSELDFYKKEKHLARQAIEMFCPPHMYDNAMKWLASEEGKQVK